MSRRAAKLSLVVALALVLGGPLLPVVPVAPAAADDSVGSLPTPEDFVTQQYEDFLSRPPDSGGLAYWSDQLRAGLDPSALVESLALSAEFEGTIAPVVRLYYAHFQRPPDYEGLTHWIGVARSGRSVAWISEEFVRSAEFAATYGSLSDDAYVDQVYLNVLGRPSDGDGRAYWVGQLARGLTRGELMVAFSDSTEYRNRLGSQVLATMLYVGLLRRVPEGDGLDYWAGVIDGGTPYRNVIAGFLGTPEYDDRIQRIYDQVQPLSGVATRSAALRPALAVKIDNVDDARPQTGVDRADIVYEEMVEGNLTRLVAVFHSDVPGVVGPVRSVRTTDIALFDQLNTPLVSASGGNAAVLAAVAQADVVDVSANQAGGAYYRDNRRSAPHNMYAYSAALYDASNHRGGLPPALFRYRAPRTDPIGGGPTGGVTIRFGRADVAFRWSSADRGWHRTQNGRAHVMANGERLSPANVAVLETPYGASPADARSPEAHTVGSGPAYVFTGGQLVVGTWQRSSSTERIQLLDSNGAEILLTPGQTFVELAPPGSISLES